MRHLIIETVEPQETEIKTFVTKLNAKELTLMLDLGLNIHELLLNEKAEFLTPGGAQYRVQLCLSGTYAVPGVGGVA